MKAILLAATILLPLVGQNSSQDNQTVSLAQPATAPPEGQQTPAPSQEQQGPNLLIEQVIFEGNNVFSSAERIRQLQLVGVNVFLWGFGRRNVYTRERFQQDAARLTRYMTERGYLNASVGEPKIRFINIADAAKTKGDVRIQLII